MIKSIFEKIFGSRNERIIKKLWKDVEKINNIYKGLHHISDEDILKKTEDFQERLSQGEDPYGEIMHEAFALVKEVCRRLVGKRWKVTGNIYEWDMIPFDVQLMGAIVLHQGKIAEMKTGEGKTLVATMPLYLNALIGRIKNTGVHLVTVNDYLARRDREWMGPVYESLGLSVGVIQAGMEQAVRKKEYLKDITYGTNNEFGFDYLRDHMVFSKDEKVQRGHYYAIIDEVDSILIDEARTPLIISGPVEQSIVSYLYRKLKPMVASLYSKQVNFINNLLYKAKIDLKQGRRGEAIKKILLAKHGMPKNKQLFELLQEPGVAREVDELELKLIKEKKLHDFDSELYFVVDEKGHTVELTEKGRKELSRKDKSLFVLPDLSSELAKISNNPNLSPREKFYERERVLREYNEKSEKLHAIKQLLKAYCLFEKDVDYVVMQGKVIIVDEFTGRLMPGRRWSDGLHEAVEAKEGVRIQQETQTLATITIQNYFRMYEKLAGMTGTAATEAQEFWEIYKLDVVVIPTNKPVRRIDYPDIIYRTKKLKFKAVAEEIKKWHEKGRPILVGTTSVEESEYLSRILKRMRIRHQVLNAKYHEKEAQIVAKAGQFGAVTIATNMAGRGTDIKLGKGTVKAYKLISEEKAKIIKEKLEKDPNIKILVLPETEILAHYLEEELTKIGIKNKIFNLKEVSIRDVEKGFENYSVIIGTHKPIDFKYNQDNVEIMEYPLPECGINTPSDARCLVCPVNHKECIKNFVPCGLYVIGTQRHEARRIDNQLRGRSGRQGDPGASKFFLSLEDDLLRLFGSDKVIQLMERWEKDKKDEPIESKLLTKAIENAQKRVEMHNFQIRKRLLEFDDVMNKQREVIYKLRDDLIEGENFKKVILGDENYQEVYIEGFDPLIPNTIWELMENYILSKKYRDYWDIESFIIDLERIFVADFTFIKDIIEKESRDTALKDLLFNKIYERIKGEYALREEVLGEERMREIERMALLFTLDSAWREHLRELDFVKEAIHLRAYGHKDPLVEYKKESFEMFENLIRKIRIETIQKIFALRIPKKVRERALERIRATKPEFVSILKQK